MRGSERAEFIFGACAPLPAPCRARHAAVDAVRPAKALRACRRRRLPDVIWLRSMAFRACDKVAARAIKSSLPACRFPIRFMQQQQAYSEVTRAQS
jgi:hypothetical protein